MKDSPLYFAHDFGARNDPKLQELMMQKGVAGIGIYWCLVEMLYEQGGSLLLQLCKSIAFALHVQCTDVEDVIANYNLFENDGEFFWSKSAISRIDRTNSISQKRKNAALSRWKSKGVKANAKQMQSNCNANADQMQCTDESFAMQTEKVHKYNNINNNININTLTEKEKEEKESPRKRFVPPTVDEVKSYITEKGYTFDAAAFVAFYESNGWMVGKNKMKNWRAACVTWSKRRESGNGSSTRSNNTATSKYCNEEWK